MTTRINEPVSVQLQYDHKLRKVSPSSIEWAGRQHQITEVGYHHTQAKGETLFHVFSVVSHSNYFKLVLNTANLHWHIEEIASGS